MSYVDQPMVTPPLESPQPRREGQSPPRVDAVGRTKGQALVETAIILPVLLILLLGAIDFGRAFFGWANLHQATRNGANFASLHATMTTAERTRYVLTVESDLYPDTSNRHNPSCLPQDPIPSPTFQRPDGTATTTPVLGDYATLTLFCDFSPLTPLMDLIVGDPLRIVATASFPIREGCINCPTPVPATPPPPPQQCFPVPAMQGKSVAGARAAWVSAGFRSTNFTVPAGTPETATVATATVTEDDTLSTCSMPAFAVYSSSVTITVVPNGAPCAAGEAVVPNMIGMTLGNARTAWQSAGFEPVNLTADGGDPAAISQLRNVTGQTTVPTSSAGVSCLDVTATTDLTTGPALPPPPPTPCRVPNLTNLTRPQGEAKWVEERFAARNFSPNGGNWVILSQSLVGGTYVTCDASIRVSQNP